MGLIMKNGIAYAGSPNETDAVTVNGHTVESDVPANAVFTDTVYDDTEIKEQLANKLDKEGDASLLSYSSPDFSAFRPSESGMATGDYERLGFILDSTEFIGTEDTGKLTTINFIKEIDGVIYIGGTNGFGTMSRDMSTYTPVLCTQDYGKMLRILDVEKTMAYDGNTVWVMTVQQDMPYCYNVENGTLEPIQCDPSLNAFQPVKIVKDTTRGERQVRVYFIQLENNPQIGYCEGEPGYIMRSINFANEFSKNGSLNDFVAFDDGNTLKMYCCMGPDIFFQTSSNSEWEILSDFITYPWGSNTVHKLYYDSTIRDDALLAFVYNQEYMETEIMTIPLGLYTLEDHYEYCGVVRTTINPSTILFGKERNIFLSNGTDIICVYGQMIDNQFSDEYVGQLEGSVAGSGPQAFVSRYIFNKANQNYYFVTGEPRLYGLSYEKENLTLSYGLGRVDEAVTTVELMSYEIADLKSQIEELRDILTSHGMY